MISLNLILNATCVSLRIVVCPSSLYSVFGILVPPQSYYLVCFMALSIISPLFSAFPKLLDCELLEDRGGPSCRIPYQI